MTAELAAVWLLRMLATYAGIGFLFALWLLARGLERIDAGTHGATLGFRIAILPATIALWPWLLARCWRASGAPPVESNAHRRAAASADPVAP